MVMGYSDIETYKGHFFDVFNVDQDKIDIEDIAHGLSMCCRFNGHLKNFYSVAEHCIAMSLMVTPENALAALMHDAAEAYLSDVPKPIKQKLPEINTLDEYLTREIFFKFGLEHQYPLADEIKIVDREICAAEARASGMHVDEWGFQPAVIDYTPKWYAPWEAEELFLSTFNKLKGNCNAKAHKEVVQRLAV